MGGKKEKPKEPEIELGLVESLGEEFDLGVYSCCRERGHVKRRAKPGSSTMDGTFSSLLAAVAVDRCDADQGGDFFLVESSKLGKFRDDGVRGAFANAGHGCQPLSRLIFLRIALNKFFNLAIEAIDFLLEEGEMPLEARLRHACLGLRVTILLGGSHDDELPPSQHHFSQFSSVFLYFGSELKLRPFREDRDHLGVDSVGLGQLVLRDREGTSPSWIDKSDAMVRVLQREEQIEFVSTRGLEHDDAGSGRGEFGDQLRMPLGRVGDFPVGPQGMNVEIGRRLRDVNSDERLVDLVHGRVPFLQMRDQWRQPIVSGDCSGSKPRSMAITLRDGV